MIRGIFFDLYGSLFVYGDMKKAWVGWLHHFHLSLKTHGLLLYKESLFKECDRFTAALGVATLDGMGPLCYDVCSENERIEVNSLVSRSLLIAAVTLRLAQGAWISRGIARQ
jgi:hypothetical protein